MLHTVALSRVQQNLLLATSQFQTRTIKCIIFTIILMQTLFCTCVCVYIYRSMHAHVDTNTHTHTYYTYVNACTHMHKHHQRRLDMLTCTISIHRIISIPVHFIVLYREQFTLNSGTVKSYSGSLAVGLLMVNKH